MATSSDLTKQLKKYDLLARLNSEELRAVAARVEQEQFHTGEILTRQGEIGRGAYFVESGRLRILWLDPHGVEREVGQLEPGDYFGETSLLLGEPRDASVQVTEDATVLYLRKSDFDELRQEYPSLLDNLQIRRDVARKLDAPRFRWQHPDEFVVISVRKHMFILVRNLIFPVFVLLACLVGIATIGAFSGIAWIVGSALAAVPAFFIIYLVFDQLNDRYVVTNERVIHDERRLLIYQSRNEAPLRAIQDVQLLQPSFSAHLINYGDLIIETAGERGHIVFRQIPDPAETQQAIFELMMRTQSVARAEERAAIRDSLQVQFGMQPPGSVPVGPPPSVPPRRGPSFSDWLSGPMRVIRFFLPPLWHVEGDTITWRKHWIVLIKPIFLPTVSILGVTALAAFLLDRSAAGRWPLILAAYSLALVFLVSWWLWRFEDWRNDFYQVTATRIIDVNRLPFYLREDRREASLGRIQNINLEVPGIIGRIFNYGSITVETAGLGELTFEYVKNPHRVQQEIFHRMERFQERQRQLAAEERRTELLTWFNVYDQIRNTAPQASQTSSSEES